MPSTITHDTFGREIYDQLLEEIGQSEDEKQAFLLGCQGPDPLFYGVINPMIPSSNSFAKKMHRYNCTDFLTALALGVPRLKELNIARAYSLGYLMHFELDSKVHPFVFSQQFAYCDAGVEGLDRNDQSEVHVAIECELDELVLTIKRGQTIATFDPSFETLRCENQPLEVISKLIEFASEATFNLKPQPKTFYLSVKAYRQVLRWLHSAYGVKRNLFGRLERLFRKHSYLQAMIHKNEKIEQSIFDNHEHYEWKDPWVKGKVRDESFWDLYNEALKDGTDHIKIYAKLIDEICKKANKNDSEKEDGRDNELKEEAKAQVKETFLQVLKITQNLNFYGCPESIADPKTGKPRN